jgi:ABC-type sugar transport system ATPase subunit
MRGIQLKDISKSFGGKMIVSNLNLNVEAGEFLVLVGPSGCGKSTSLRMVAGLEPISSGELWIDGKLVNNVSAKDRNVAMVFQSYALYPNMTVRENLAFGMKIRHEASQKIELEVKRVADILGLGPHLNRRPNALSGGQAQRVALGRALIRQPTAFLFDEPLSNLDAELRVQMRGEIASLQKSLGTTTIYVTHDQTEAMTLGHRVAVLRDGVLMQLGTPLELYNNPENQFVASFIGSPSMNLLELPLSEGKLIWADSSVVTLADGFLVLLGRRGRIILGVRPEHVKLSARGKSDVNTIGSVPGKVELVEALGHETLIYCKSPNGRIVIREPSDRKQELRNGDSVTIEFFRDKLLIFDADTGQRLRQVSACA